jgi:hypothetical protein
MECVFLRYPIVLVTNLFIYLFLSLFTKVSKQVVKEVPMTKMVVYEAVEIIEGIQRPIVKSPDINGRMRTLMT